MTKNILTTFIILALGAGISGCGNSFLETNYYKGIDVETGLSTVDNISTALNGTYYDLFYYYFAGNYAINIGDIPTDISYWNGKTGHFDGIYTYTYTDTDTTSHTFNDSDGAVNTYQDAGAAGNLFIQNVENLEGGSGNDTLIGNTSANTLLGGDGADWLIGKANNNELDGQVGIDTVDYSFVTSGVGIKADMNAGTDGTDSLGEVTYEAIYLDTLKNKK